MYHAYPGQSVVTAQIGRRAHPDVLANTIAQYAVAQILGRDPTAKADLNIIVGKSVFLDGKIGSANPPSQTELAGTIARTLVDSGYTAQWGYDPGEREIFVSTSGQSPNIRAALSNGGAGDTITKVGFATNESEEYLPMPHILVRRIASRLDQAFASGTIEGLGPDGKLNLAMAYGGGKPAYVSEVIIAAQHKEGIDIGRFKEDIGNLVISELGSYYDFQRTGIMINAGGLFVYGGPLIDAGVKGKKDADHTYGNIVGHTGGSAYGKDPNKVDFHALVAARQVAKSIVAAGIADVARVDITYVIGVENPVAVSINTFGTSDVPESKLVEHVRCKINLRPKEVIERLGLRENLGIFPETAKYFFKPNPFPWEKIIGL